MSDTQKKDTIDEKKTKLVEYKIPAFLRHEGDQDELITIEVEDDDRDNKSTTVVEKLKTPMRNCWYYEDEDQEEEMTDEELKQYNDKMDKLFKKLRNR